MSFSETCRSCKGRGDSRCPKCRCKDCAGVGKVSCLNCIEGRVGCNKCGSSGWVGANEACPECNVFAYKSINDEKLGKGGIIAYAIIPSLLLMPIISILAIPIALFATFLLDEWRVKRKARGLRQSVAPSGKVACSICKGSQKNVCKLCNGDGWIGCAKCNGRKFIQCGPCNGVGQVESRAGEGLRLQFQRMPIDQLRHEYQKRSDQIRIKQQEIRRLQDEEREDRDWYENWLRETGARRKAGDWPGTLDINPGLVNRLDSDIDNLKAEMSLIDSAISRNWK
jgi:hypothetical protein